MILKEQRLIIWGTLLGDAYLQKTGKKNARLKIEHSAKQKDYIFWKYEKLKNLAQDKPKLIKRFNPKFQKEYYYYRFQTHSSPILGKYKRWFYKEGKKVVPENVKTILKHPLVLAVWFMDDGSIDTKNKCLEIYLPKYDKEGIEKLLKALEEIHNLKPKNRFKKGYPVLVFCSKERDKLIEIIRDYVIESIRYKISFGPVTTGGV